MPTEILMPALSPTMEEGTLAKWLVKEGDTVSSGDLLAEIETDKATMEFEAVDEGVIGKLLIAEGTEGVKVNTAIAVLLAEGESAGDIGAAKAPAAKTEAAAPAKAEAAPAPAAAAPAAPAQASAPDGASAWVLSQPGWSSSVAAHSAAAAAAWATARSMNTTPRRSTWCPSGASASTPNSNAVTGARNQASASSAARAATAP